MRILTVTHQYPRQGDELFAPYNRLQFAELASIHPMRVVAPIPWRQRYCAGIAPLFESTKYRNRDGILVEHPVFFYPPRFMEHAYGRFFLGSARPTVCRAAAEFDPDVILSCWAHPDGWAAVQFGQQLGIPVVVKVIGSDVLVLSGRPRRRRGVAEALRQADAVVAVSRDLARRVESLGVDPYRIRVVPEGVNGSLFSPGSREAARGRLGLPVEGKRLLFVGSILRGKGVGVLVEACRLLKDRGLDFDCDLVGKGAHETAIRKLIRRLQLEATVRLAGPSSQMRLPDWYRASDLVVLPSFSEGIPNVLREAMMCGRGFVASNVGGIPEISRPEFATLVKPGDPQSLADAIDAALCHPPQVPPGVASEINVSWCRSAQMIAQVLTETVK
jgi:glycosyltransferase involved in cell wall biosynthesis